MTTKRLVQVCVYANWHSESFEIWRFYHINRSRNEISKEMRSLFLWIFSQITNMTAEDLESATFTIGGTDEGSEVGSAKAKDITRRIYYGWYQGVCLDKDRLQYFKPERIIKHGIVELLRDNEADVYELPKPKVIEPTPSFTLELRRMLGDDPKRIEIDKMRSRLGLQTDVLFDWKKEYRIRKD